MSAQSKEAYTEALQNYYEFMHLETDPYDKSDIYYNREILIFVQEMENIQKP